jgi:hypothetical protein
MTETNLSRRSFIQRLAVIGAASVGATYLVACGGDGDKDDAAGGSTAALDCTDVSALSEDQQATRTALQYVDVSVTEGQNCANCQQYQAAADTAACGACLVVPGSINPAGHCTSWAEKVS